MTCGLDIVVAVLGIIAAVATATTALSETLPFIKRISGNGVIHTITHIFNKEKCNSTTSISPCSQDNPF